MTLQRLKLRLEQNIINLLHFLKYYVKFLVLMAQTTIIPNVESHRAGTFVSVGASGPC